MAMRRPVEVFSPGDILKEELEERGWTQNDLAAIIGRHETSVHEIIVGKRGVSPETARALAAALGTSAELWMNLDAAYQLSQVRDDDNDEIARRAKVYAKAPVKDMVRRGWIEPSKNVAVLEARVCKFLEIASIDDEPDALPHAARKSTAYSDPPSPAQMAWLYRARQLARTVHAKPYSEDTLTDAVSQLRLLSHVPQEARHVPRILSEAGIRFVVVQPLPGGRIDGACFWVDGAPVVAMSLRFDRIDNFWFVLFHELKHVAKGEGRPWLDADMDTVKDENDLTEAEIEANKYASETLITPQQIENFIARVGPFYSAPRIEAFAHTIGVHPAVVVGQLQHRGEVAYSSFRKMMAPVREWITASALTDGWGVALPAQL